MDVIVEMVERESEGGRERRLYVKMYECVLVSSVRWRAAIMTSSLALRMVWFLRSRKACWLLHAWWNIPSPTMASSSWRVGGWA